jgi:hypothetical protein
MSTRLGHNPSMNPLHDMVKHRLVILETPEDGAVTDRMHGREPIFTGKSKTEATATIGDVNVIWVSLTNGENDDLNVILCDEATRLPAEYNKEIRTLIDEGYVTHFRHHAKATFVGEVSRITTKCRPLV